MKTWVLIPARLGSTRLPRKPLADIAGRPMVVRVVDQCVQAKVHRVVVASDADEVIGVVKQHGYEAVLTRADHASGTDRIAEASAQLGIPDEDIVVNVQGDEPLIEPALIEALACKLADTPDAAMATAAHPIVDSQSMSNPHVVKVVLNYRDEAIYFSRCAIPFDRDHRRNACGQAMLRHVGIYAYRPPFLRRFPELSSPPLEQLEALEQLRALWHGYRIAFAAPGVDSAEDLERMRAHFRLLLPKPPSN
ncbi:MAG: 3-deoxy-manno-octulosonate cytidylyltransferase [Betaproteobacteria bacterium]|nr:3-deoxy-manno-octulosonate cytidylyltransferase [Betaproteobacteria bacterium]